jgi:putative peptidoglycan lipid II flippase
MMPYLFFVSLAAFYGGMLNSINRFMPFAATSIIFNISLILFALYYNDASTKAHSVAYGVLAAGVIEVVWMLFFIKREDLLVPLVWPKLTFEVKGIIKKIGPGIIGSGIYQINVWVDMIIVSFIPGGMSYIYYADRIMQLPLALIATATSTALLPALSRRLAESNSSQAHDLKEDSIKITAFFIVPTALVFFVFSHDIVSILLERGLFAGMATDKTAAALKMISIGLPAFALLKLFSNIFYAFGNTSIPVKIASCSLIINIALSISLLPYFEHVAISIASTVAGWCSAVALIIIAQRMQYYHMSINVIKSIILYCIIGVTSVAIMIYFSDYLNFILCCCIGGAFYLFFVYISQKINILQK